jgi:hypothetical protein
MGHSTRTLAIRSDAECGTRSHGDNTIADNSVKPESPANRAA